MTEPIPISSASPDPGRWPTGPEWRDWFLAQDPDRQLAAAEQAVRNAQDMTEHDRTCPPRLDPLDVVTIEYGVDCSVFPECPPIVVEGPRALAASIGDGALPKCDRVVVRKVTPWRPM